MAVIYILDIKYGLQHTIEYVANKEKTINPEYEESYEELHKVLGYTTNDAKTEKQFYVSGVNCNPETAYSQMAKTQKGALREGKILGYHIMQSFKPGEGTPEMIHEIGVKFAEKMWGDRFEVVVSTHLNTNCLHNHFVLNNVSFIDRKRYYDNKETMKEMKRVSDEICKEYELSVILNPKKRSRKSYDVYMAEKNGGWTKNEVIRRDIDNCIKVSVSAKEFYRELSKLGYTFDFYGKHPTIKHPNFDRPRRFKTLGDDYTTERIEERILEKYWREKVEVPEQEDVYEEYFLPLEEPDYQEIYVTFINVFDYVSQRPFTNIDAKQYFQNEIKEARRYIAEHNLLTHYNIENGDQLEVFKSERESEFQEIIEARDYLRNKLKRVMRAGNEKEITEVRNDIKLFTERLRILRKDIRICERIEKREPQLEEKIEEIKTTKIRKELMGNEHRRRSCGRDCEDKPARS